MIKSSFNAQKLSRISRSLESHIFSSLLRLQSGNGNNTFWSENKSTIYKIKIQYIYYFFLNFLLNFRFWGTCAEHARLLHRYTHGSVICCLPPLHLYLALLPMLSLSNSPPPLSLPYSPQQTPVCSAPLPGSMCSHCLTPAYEWEHAVFHFLFLCQFAENDGLLVHPCPYKGHELIFFDGCIIFHCVYVPHFPCLVNHWWAFGLVSGLCYCKQCCNEYSCAYVLIVERFIIIWIYT